MNPYPYHPYTASAKLQVMGDENNRINLSEKTNRVLGGH